MGNTQFGFRNSVGTREAIFSLEMIVQRSKDINHDIMLVSLIIKKLPTKLIMINLYKY